MTPALFLHLAIEPALTHLLPERMNTQDARATILAITLQESELAARRQKKNGPARSFAQFEKIAIEEVLTHRATAMHARRACEMLVIKPSVAAVHAAIEYHDVLCVVFSRLNLWRLPTRLPRRDEVDYAWNEYLAAWIPGKPKPDTWPQNFATAWSTIEASTT